VRAPSRRARVRAADAHWLAPSLTFIVVFSYFGLYEVARELEDPFIHPPNEAPLVAVQQSFNQRLLSGWEALEGCYASECAPEGMEGLGLRAITTGNVEALEAAWRQRCDHEGEASLAATPSGARARVGPCRSFVESDNATLRAPGGPSDARGAELASPREAPSTSRRISGTSHPLTAKVPRGVQVVS
jgi:hypothetical protein